MIRRSVRPRGDFRIRSLLFAARAAAETPLRAEKRRNRRIDLDPPHHRSFLRMKIDMGTEGISKSPGLARRNVEGRHNWPRKERHQR